MNLETIRSEDQFYTHAHRSIGATVGEFWQWDFSDLIDNATRGVLAEFLAGKALGVTFMSPRVRWDDYDLTTREGIRVETKASGVVQSWKSRASPPVFSGLIGKALTEDGAAYSGGRVAKSDVFVFCHQTARSREEYDPLNVSQWEFFVVPKRTIEDLKQRTIRLSRVRAIGKAVSFFDLRGAVLDAAAL